MRLNVREATSGREAASGQKQIPSVFLFSRVRTFPIMVLIDAGPDLPSKETSVFEQTALYAYLGTFLALVAAGVGFPIPEELPIVFAGAMVGHAAEDGLSLRWWIMLPICILGVVISDGMLYGMGRFWGPRLLEKRFMRRLIPPDKRARIEENFQTYGVLVLLFARFLPAIRSPIFIMAGVTRVSFARFLLADGIYAIPGVTLLFTLAFWFGDQFRDLVVSAEGKVEKLRPILILLGLTACAGYLLYHFFRHPVATGDPEAEMPLVGQQIAAKMSHSDLHFPPPPAAPPGPDAQAVKDTGPKVDDTKPA